MDDKADNPRDLDGAPDTVRTAVTAVRPVEAAAPPPPQDPKGSSRVMFSVRPGHDSGAETSATQTPSHDDAGAHHGGRIEPVFQPQEQPGGFLPAGAGLTPAGLLGPSASVGQMSEPAPQTQLSARPAASAQLAPQPIPAPPAGLDQAVPAPKRTFADYLRMAGKWTVIAAMAWTVFMTGLILLYRFVDPPFSALMAQRWLSGETVDRDFIPIDAMAPALVKSVLVSEDGRFCEHHGIDLDAIQTALEKAGDGTPRGASTISMQVAKNLFLWPSKSYLRKALEVPLTLGIELVWPKRRIMEVYLNIAEWGPGVYGAEAAARHHFSKPALHLGEREAALLAVSLPNPITRDAGQPGAGTRRLAGLIQARANRASRYQTSCVLPQPGRGQAGWKPQVRRESAP